MEFNHFLSSYYPDPSYGGDRLYKDMVEQAVLAEKLGYRGVTIPEHHLINILLVPDPLQMAVKVACVTSKIEIITSVSVLPLHDMRIFAGAAIQADILCEGRLILGVGRGAFAYEMARLGTPIETSREKFDESLNLLLTLFTQEEVSWKGKYYNFDALTVMPRPVTRPMPQMMIAALVPPAIHACAKRGFHIQTTPLDATMEKMKEQVDAFHRGKAELGAAGDHLRLALSRVCLIAKDDADVKRKTALAYEYYGRFNNVFTGPGLVENGVVASLPQKQTIEELSQNIIICTASEMVDRIAYYAELGIDDFIMNVNVGEKHAESIEAMERSAAEVMPHTPSTSRTAACGGAARVKSDWVATASCDRRVLRDMFGCFMTGVTVVATRDGLGAPAAFTANSFTSVSLDPPLVLVCIARSAPSAELFSKVDRFSINILGDWQRELSTAFASPSPAKQSALAALVPSDPPILDDSLANIICERHELVDAGDHLILIGRVERFRAGHGNPLGFFRGSYVGFGLAARSLEQMTAVPLRVGGLLEHDGRVVLQRRVGADHWNVPSAPLKSGKSHSKAIGSLFSGLGITASSSLLYSVFQEEGERHTTMVFLTDAADLNGMTSADPDIEVAAFGAEDEPWTLVRGYMMQGMLHRYFREREAGSFGLYCDTEDGGRVAPIGGTLSRWEDWRPEDAKVFR